MEAGATTTMTAKLSILNPREYDLWLMMIEQYFLMTDYSLWEVIKNGKKVLTKPVGSSEQTYEPTPTEEKQNRKNEMKARGTLLMALPNKDQLKFLSYQDVKLLMEAIEKRYGGNKESKKVQRTLLKQQYENFTASKLETISLDDLYNNLKIYRPEISGSSNTNQNPQNMDFASSKSTSSTNKADTTASGVSTAHTQGRSLDMNGRRIGFDKTKVECFNCYKNGHFARECRAPKNQDNRGKEYGRTTVQVETPIENALIAQDGIGGDKVLAEYTQNVEKVEKERDELKLTLEKLLNSSKALNSFLDSQVSDKSKAGLEYKATSPAVESFVNSSEILEKQENRSDKGYHAVPPPFTGNYMPPKRNLRLIDEHFESEYVDVSTVLSSADKTVKTVDITHKAVLSTEEPKSVMKNNFGPPIIEDWHSDDDSEDELSPTIEVKTVKPSVEKIESVKTHRETVKTAESHQPHKHSLRGNKRIWNNLMHMTGNKCYLTDFEAFDGGFVSFKDGKGIISGKDKIKTEKLDFDDVCFCKELKYNLFSVSQKCTNIECLVLSSNFKLLDESQVLLRVPRKDNIYSVDLKSVVPTGGLTCLFAKATLDESNLWHRRLGQINFKTMNKLVKRNLVRGLPFKIFQNNNRCVACQKGKQHKASYKAKLVNTISKPLYMLHMDLFGPTNVKSLMKKSYCLVITDNFSRFSWVFFLATKGETSEILKTFIIGIKNQLDCKVKVIRSDNGTEFKNSVMTQFCDDKEAVNTACYVLNRALVTKPHNKTPYELIRGRPPLIDFMKPFGCPVTILNTKDNLDKFEGKADEGYFVGYLVEPKEKIVAGQAEKKKELEQEYILIPISTTGPLISQDAKDSAEDAGKKAPEVDVCEASDNGGQDNQVSRSEDGSLFQHVIF
nr:hypothetical protein [Tanacetum cinerariifolium]